MDSPLEFLQVFHRFNQHHVHLGSLLVNRRDSQRLSLHVIRRRNLRVSRRLNLASNLCGIPRHNPHVSLVHNPHSSRRVSQQDNRHRNQLLLLRVNLWYVISMRRLSFSVYMSNNTKHNDIHLSIF